MNVKHEKSIILDIVKHRLYDDGKHDSSFLDMFELLVIAQCCEPKCEHVVAVLFGMFHDYNFDESPLATWAVGGFLGPEEGSYAFCHGLHSNNGVLSIYNSEDAFSGIKVEGFTTSWSAAKLANTYGYSAGYTGPSATIHTDLGQNNGPGSKSGKLNWHR